MNLDEVAYSLVNDPRRMRFSVISASHRSTIPTCSSKRDTTFLPRFCVVGLDSVFSASARAWFTASRRRRNSWRVAALTV